MKQFLRNWLGIPTTTQEAADLIDQAKQAVLTAEAAALRAKLLAEDVRKAEQATKAAPEYVRPLNYQMVTLDAKLDAFLGACGVELVGLPSGEFTAALNRESQVKPLAIHTKSDEIDELRRRLAECESELARWRRLKS